MLPGSAAYAPASAAAIATSSIVFSSRLLVSVDPTIGTATSSRHGNQLPGASRLRTWRHHRAISARATSPSAIP